MKNTTDLIHELFSLDGKCAVITGSGGGIGRALAVAFSQAGAVIGAHNRSAAPLAETLRQIDLLGGRAVGLNGDLTDPGVCRPLIQQAHAALGRIDILVNCAGMNRRKPLDEVTQDDFDTITAVNVRAAFFLSQAVHPIMRAQGGGKIVNIGSLTSSIGLGGISVYGLGKAGLGQLTKTMALEWAGDNIQANCLAPGFIDTPLNHKALWGDAKKSAWILERTAARRPGTTADLLGAALLLASPGSDFITGQTITVDGGFLAGGWWDA